jgi:lipoprotein-anchoring transpeptidase ErfK/SrfK
MRFGATFALMMLSTVTVSAAPAGGLAPTQAVHPVIEPAFDPSDAAAQPAAYSPAFVPTPAPAVSEPPAMSASLEPGEFVWHPERSTSGNVEIVVSIPLQLAYIYRGDTLIGMTTVSTGRRGHETPTGRFPIMEKQREHYSNLYNSAPMPFMQRLTWGGVALHAGQIPGRPASHGCVRLPLAFARLLFTVTRVGTNVHIIDASPSALVALSVARGELARGSTTTLAMVVDVRGTLSVR